VSLDLSNPVDIITTQFGSLLLDDTLKGKVYLKGLLLEGESVKPYKYGYNFFSSTTGRDRRRLTNSAEEARIVAKIWEEAIKLKEESALPLFLEVLQAEEQLGDAHLAENTISADTAKRIWKELLAQGPERQRFMYYIENGDKVYGFGPPPVYPN
jgi:hypothetical protein